MVCGVPTVSCFERSCQACKNTDHVREIFEKIFEEIDMDEITYKVWAKVDRCTMLQTSNEPDEFLDTLFIKLEELLLHDFISTKQSNFFGNLKNQLLEGELLVLLDFAENYAFVIQDAVQAFHWNNNQATLLPVMVYYKENNQLKHCCFTYVSECLKHDSISVYMYQRHLVDILKQKFNVINKIYYMSDGAPQQFKNKKAFSNLANHFDDFGIPAEWHFFATSHGKGPCDGIAGSVKRLAFRASLQRRSENPILKPVDLYDWAITAIKNITFYYFEENVYEETESFLKERFSKSITIKGTLGYHAFIPILDDSMYINVKTYSDSTSSKKVNISKE